MNNDVFTSGDIINNQYKVISLIGKGGIGTTYKVRDLKKNTIVVLKTLDLRDVHDWKEIELFEREISSLKNIQHKNIPGYYDNFEINKDGKTLYALVMEFIDGKNLYDSVKEGNHFSEEEVQTILKQLLSIVSYIHTLHPPLIHRDINPKNIIRSPGGEIFLVDFGAAGSLTADTHAASNSSTFVGTIGYMPPEQMYGKSIPASDIYSLGVTMLFLLSGKEPSAFNLKNMRLDYRPYLRIQGHLKKIIDAMIEPDSDKRIESASRVLILLDKKKQSTGKKYKKEIVIKTETSDLSDVDTMIEAKRKQKRDREKEKKENEERRKKRDREKELVEIKKADRFPSRIFINKTDEGTLLTMGPSLLVPYIKNKFVSDLVLVITFFIFGFAFMIPIYTCIREDLGIVLISHQPILNFIIFVILYILLSFLSKLTLTILWKFKECHLLVTKKNNVLLYRKSPKTPIVMGKKKDLTVRIDKRSYPAGNDDYESEAWKKIRLSIGNESIHDTGFKADDVLKVQEFCKNHDIKYDEY